MEARSLEPVEVMGRTMTRYQATQWQRSKEREVRRAKLEAKVAEAAGGDPSKARERARRLSREYREAPRRRGWSRTPAGSGCPLWRRLVRFGRFPSVRGMIGPSQGTPRPHGASATGAGSA